MSLGTKPVGKSNIGRLILIGSDVVRRVLGGEIICPVCDRPPGGDPLSGLPGRRGAGVGPGVRARGGGTGGGHVNRPLWRWHLWCALNWLHVRYRWRWLDRAWAAAIAPEWLGDGGADFARGEPF